MNSTRNIGSEDAINPVAGFETVKFVFEGMKVIAPVRQVAPHLIPEHANETTGVACIVATAAGTHARIVNENRGVDRWVHISTLCVRKSTSG